MLGCQVAPRLHATSLQTEHSSHPPIQPHQDKHTTQAGRLYLEQVRALVGTLQSQVGGGRGMKGSFEASGADGLPCLASLAIFPP